MGKGLLRLDCSDHQAYYGKVGLLLHVFQGQYAMAPAYAQGGCTSNKHAWLSVPGHLVLVIALLLGTEIHNHKEPAIGHTSGQNKQMFLRQVLA